MLSFYGIELFLAMPLFIGLHICLRDDTIRDMFPAQTPGWAIGLSYVLLVWSYIWKGIALWRASKHNQRNWFIVMLVLNTVGILEIVYLFRFSKKRMTLQELKDLFHNTFFTKDK